MRRALAPLAVAAVLLAVALEARAFHYLAILQTTPETRPPPPALPAGIEPGQPSMLPIPGDRPVFVIHAPAENLRAILYLHGLCGNVRAAESFRRAAAAHGTLIGLLGDRACPGERFRWTKNVEDIRARAQRALLAVKKARGGLLNTADVVLFGYSQGAARAEQLARRHPDEYRRVVLGGPPGEPHLASLGSTEALAVFGGELESTAHMRAGAEIISAAGRPARFFLLPRAKHGEFGPEAERVIDDLLDWVVDPSLPYASDSGKNRVLPAFLRRGPD